MGLEIDFHCYLNGYLEWLNPECHHQPLVAIIMILFVIASVWHMKIGMQVVLEDYVTDEKAKLALIIANNFFSAAVGLASIYAIIKLSSGV